MFAQNRKKWFQHFIHIYAIFMIPVKLKSVFLQFFFAFQWFEKLQQKRMNLYKLLVFLIIFLNNFNFLKIFSIFLLSIHWSKKQLLALKKEQERMEPVINKCFKIYCKSRYIIHIFTYNQVYIYYIYFITEKIGLLD